MYDYSRLLGKIKEKSKSNAVFSSKLGISERTLSQKLNNKVDFKQHEIIKSCQILDIPDEQIGLYFFDLKT